MQRLHTQTHNSVELNYQVDTHPLMAQAQATLNEALTDLSILSNNLDARFDISSLVF